MTQLYVRSPGRELQRFSTTCRFVGVPYERVHDGLCRLSYHDKTGQDPPSDIVPCLESLFDIFRIGVAELDPETRANAFGSDDFVFDPEHAHGIYIRVIQEQLHAARGDVFNEIALRTLCAYMEERLLKRDFRFVFAEDFDPEFVF